MAILQITPTSGNGAGVVSIKALSAWNGRDDRTATVRFQASNDPKPHVDLLVTQKGLGEQLEIQNPSGQVSIGKNDESFMLSGRMNSSKLKLVMTGSSVVELNSAMFSWGIASPLENTVELDLTRDSNRWESAVVNIPNDPGATEWIIWRLTCYVMKNNTVNSKVSDLMLIGDEVSASKRVSQQAANYLTVTPTELTFTAEGGSQTISIDTNESWTIE